MGVQNNLVKQSQKPTFSGFMETVGKKKVMEIVGGKDGQRFITAIISAVSANPTLAECEFNTILSSALLGESLKLSPSPQLGQYYLVPYNNKKKGTKEAQFQLGYKGYIQLAIRSGQYKKINVLALKEGELVRYDPLNEEIKVNMIEDDLEREATATSGYYAMFEYSNGFKKAMYWSKKKMLAHADQYSQAFTVEKMEKLQAGKVPKNDLWMYASFWYKDFDAMALKTMIRQLISKWGIMSIELQQAIDADIEAEPANDSSGSSGADYYDIPGDVQAQEEPRPQTDPKGEENDIQDGFFNE